MLMRSLALFALALLSCAGEAMRSTQPVVWVDAPSALHSIQIEHAPLDARAFAAEAAFSFPRQSRELVRSIQRAEFARLEAKRLDLLLPSTILESRLAGNIAAIEDGLGAVSKEDWARSIYEQPWPSVRAAMKERLHNQLLYQMVLRANAWLSGRVRLHVWVTRDEAQAKAWATELASGVNPRELAGESLDVGQMPDGSFSPMSRNLPQPLGEWLETANVHDVLGPFHFDGDAAWHVVRVSELFEPQSDLPPRQVLFDELDSQPIGALEARAWFEEMSRRYNARGNLPGISALSSPFVPNRPN